MKKVILDTETTDLKPGNIIQLAYLVLDQYDTIQTAKNYYFMADYISPSATGVHGITRSKLSKLSSGMRFKDYTHEIYYDLKDCCLVAQNINFDYRFLEKEFMRHGLELSVSDTFCTMKYMTEIMKMPGNRGKKYKWPNLEEIIEFLQIEKSEIQQLTRARFGVENVHEHDARFDAVSVYFIYSYIQSFAKADC